MTDEDLLHVLIIDDEENNAFKYRDAVNERCDELDLKVDVRVATSADESITQMDSLVGEESVFVFCDNELGSSWKIEDEVCKGLDMLPKIRDRLAKARTVLYSTKDPESDTAKVALQLGAYDVVNRRSLATASQGLLAVLAQMAAIDARIRQAEAAGQEGRESKTDPLAHLLMKIRTSMMMVGRYGSIWFQNKHNQRINRSEVRGGELCYTHFHGWNCQKCSCPWCPTIESMQKGESSERTLLLPIKREDSTGAYEIGCVRMLSEPLWPLAHTSGRAASQSCAGAIECSFGLTREWNSKPAIHRSLDLLATLVGLLQREKHSAIQVNLYEIGRSQRTCRPVIACVAERADNGMPSPSDRVRLLVHERAASLSDLADSGPGPAAECPKETTDDFPSAAFRLSDHPATHANTDGEISGRRVGPHSLEWKSTSCEADNVVWHHFILECPHEPTERTAVLEIGCPDQLGCIDHCLAENKNCDLDLFLKELGTVAKELRNDRMKSRDSNVPLCPRFDHCDSYGDLWKSVEGAMATLEDAVVPGDERVWWHFRKYVEGEDEYHQVRHFLQLDQEAADAGDSPYAKHAVKACPEVDVSPRNEWKDDHQEPGQRQKSFDAFRVTTPSSKSGSSECRITGQMRFCHEAPMLDGGTNLSKALHSAEEEGDFRAVAELATIASFGDFPVGRKVEPVGTFHVLSDDEDLFSDAVLRYLIDVTLGIERAVLRIRAKKKTDELDRLISRKHRERVIRYHLSGRTARVFEALQGDPASMDRKLLGWLACSVSTQQQLLLDDPKIERKDRGQKDVNLTAALASAVDNVLRECKANPMFSRFAEVPLEWMPPGVELVVLGDRELLTVAFSSVLFAGVLLGGNGPKVEPLLNCRTVAKSELPFFSARIRCTLNGNDIRLLKRVWLCEESPGMLLSVILEQDTLPHQLRAALIELASTRLLFAEAVAEKPSYAFSEENDSIVFEMQFSTT